MIAFTRRERNKITVNPLITPITVQTEATGYRRVIAALPRSGSRGIQADSERIP